MTTTDEMLLTDLPDVVFTRICSYFSYDEIAKNRLICKKFNEVGWFLLNRGFVAAEKYQSAALKAVKTQLPRRESERRKHPLCKKCDVLVAIETRLSMLSMAFNRFIESKLCCFIPGRVIDELFRVMKSLDTYTECQPPHQILQELRDVSTMAIEHFDEKIAPILKNKEFMALASHRSGNVFNIPGRLITSNSSFYNFPSMSPICRRTPGTKTMKEYRTRIKRVEQTQKKQILLSRYRVSTLLKEIRRCKRTIKELQTTVNEQMVRLSNNETITNDLKRQFDEWKICLSQKFVPPLHSGADDHPTSSGITNSVDDISDPANKKRKLLEE